MAGTVEELMNIKDEAIENIHTLTEEELFSFNEVLIDLLRHVNGEMRYLMKENKK